MDTDAFGSPMTGGKKAIDAYNEQKMATEKTVDELFGLIKAYVHMPTVLVEEDD